MFFPHRGGWNFPLQSNQDITWTWLPFLVLIPLALSSPSLQWTESHSSKSNARDGTTSSNFPLNFGSSFVIMSSDSEEEEKGTLSLFSVISFSIVSPLFSAPSCSFFLTLSFSLWVVCPCRRRPPVCISYAKGEKMARLQNCWIQNGQKSGIVLLRKRRRVVDGHAVRGCVQR